MIGDTVTVPWYPFTKNLSSRGSILFVADGLTINPFEIVLALTTLAWILQMLGDVAWTLKARRSLASDARVHRVRVRRFDLQLQLGGYDTTVAVWKRTAMLYIPILYILITNLLTTGRQYERLFMCAMLGVTVQSLLSLQYFHSLDPLTQENLDSLTEHAASIHVDAHYLRGRWLFLLPRCNHVRRIWITIALVPCVWMFVLAQRRAAAIALIVGVIVLAVLIYQRRRRAAISFIIIAALVGLVYTVAFWNSTGSIAFGAQAVKSVLAPGKLSGRTRARISTARSKRTTSGTRSGPRAVRASASDNGSIDQSRSRHQLLRFLGIHPPQLDPVDLDEDRRRSVSWRCST